MTDRSGPTLRTADDVDGRFYIQPQLAGDDVVSTDHEPGHANQDSGAAATLNYGQGSLLLQTS